MSAKLTALFTFAFGAIIGLVVGCQKYDFEPVTPTALSQTTQSYSVVAKKFKPNVMVVVDNSGSMSLPVNTTLPACRPGGTLCGTDSCNPSSACNVDAGCPTRSSELRKAMSGFFADAGTVARFGLTTFPAPADYCAGGEVCGPGTVRVDIPQVSDDDPQLQTTANQINSVIQSDVVGGGTPTGATIQSLATYAGFAGAGRDNFIILETDGVPNCNDNNPNRACLPDGGQNPSCACTIGNCCSNQVPITRGCLDQDATVTAIAALASASNRARTFVIGFGDDAAASAATLNAMAEAGGMPRSCPDGGNDECGTNNTCVQATKKCAKEYYLANTSQDLADVLFKIGFIIGFDPCAYDLTETPSDPSLLSVLINGQSVRSGPQTWRYQPNGPRGPQVIFLGPLCNQVSAATPSSPVQVDIRIVRTL